MGAAPWPGVRCESGPFGAVTVPARPEEHLRRLESEWNAHPGMQHLGARLDLTDPRAVRAVIDPLQPHHRGGLGTDAVNGAVIAGVVDVVVGLTGYLHTGGRRAGVAQLHVQYLRPVHGDRLEVIGRPLRAGRTLVFVTAEAVDAEGVVCARGDGIVAVVAGDGTSEAAF